MQVLFRKGPGWFNGRYPWHAAGSLHINRNGYGYNTWQVCLVSQMPDVSWLEPGDVPRGFMAPAIIPVGLWTHVVLLFDGTSVALYVDANLNAAFPATRVLDDDSPVLFGADRDTVEHVFFDGVLSDIRIYNRALDNAEIAQLSSPM